MQLKILFILYFILRNIWIILKFICFLLFQLFAVYLNVDILSLSRMELMILIAAHGALCFALVARMGLMITHRCFDCC